MREQYLMQLKKLHEAMLEMGELCQQAIGLAIRAPGECNDALIAQEQETDSEIDKLEREIESLCLQLLLKQQPVASDLRDISAALKMISDMGASATRHRISRSWRSISRTCRYITSCTWSRWPRRPLKWSTAASMPLSAGT